ncbi:hemerythrin domain-containing protein [Flavobacterium galactosidilyticum]|uniref:hemerythrin domain-containing protein n=1 Tax=Flavobacterium galactosidilyticum TaxID=2893886 RepID=UPI001E4D0ECC|nr:hemerythrin domain-containing protein [Flavobacterium sp. F-340]UFH47841.1 hemerythrin domain-containing protein [Flavobacterium sp. F-340]
MISNRPLKRVLELQPLSHDHHHGLQLCWKIRTGFSKQVEVERIKNYADWFFTNHLVPHFELEEKYIFTILDQKNEFVKQALTDHRRLKRLFSETTNLEKSLGLIEEELEKHIRFEERILFPEVQKEATSEQLAEIAKIHNHELFVENNEDTFWLS